MAPSPYHPIQPFALCNLTGVARITIVTCFSFPVTIHTPVHVVSVHHFNRPLFFSGQTVTGRAVDVALDMNPVGKDDKLRELVHLLPRDLLFCLDVPDDLKRFRLLAHGVGGMTGLAEFNAGEARGAISLGISMAEVAVQIERLRMASMVEENGLIDRHPCEDRKDRKEGRFGLNGKPVVGHDGKK